MLRLSPCVYIGYRITWMYLPISIEIAPLLCGPWVILRTEWHLLWERAEDWFTLGINVWDRNERGEYSQCHHSGSDERGKIRKKKVACCVQVEVLWWFVGQLRKFIRLFLCAIRARGSPQWPSNFIRHCVTARRGRAPRLLPQHY